MSCTQVRQFNVMNKERRGKYSEIKVCIFNLSYLTSTQNDIFKATNQKLSIYTEAHHCCSNLE